MNLARLGLDRRPFRSTPTLELFVALPPHDAILASLRNAFANDDGIALLDGRPGTGKTLLALRFLESLGREVLPIYVPSARFQTISDLYQAILFDLGKPYRDLSEHELRLTVTEQLLQALSDRRRVVLVLDEAQHLGAELLEEIRLLDNWEARGTKALFTLLIATPDLRDRLKAPEYESLGQRICCRMRAEPLSTEVSRTYLQSQIELCCRKPEELVQTEAMQLLARHAGGLPRVLNQLGWACLQLIAETEQDCVDVEVAYESLSQAGIEIPETDESARPAYPSGAAQSKPRERREPGGEREPTAAAPPKQKARNRRAA